MPQRFTSAAELSGNVEGYQQGRGCVDYKERPQLKVEGVLYLTRQKQEVAVEVDRKQHHEHCHNYLDIRREASHAGVVESEAAGAAGGEACVQCLIYCHSAEEQHNKFDRGEHKIDGIQQHCRSLDARHQLADGRPRAFRLHNVHVLAAGEGDKCHDEHQHAHSAYPVGEAPPHARGVGDGFHIGQDTCAGGGESRHGLKERVDEVRDLPGKIERQRAERTQYYPAEGYYHAALACVQLTLFRFFQYQQAAYQQAHAGGQQVSPQGGFTECQRCYRGHCKEHSLKQQYPAENICYHSVVHDRLLLLENIGDIVQRKAAGYDYHGVAYLQAVMTARYEHFLVPEYCCNENVGFERKFHQRNIDYR